jgi:hypothetical protein
MLSIASRATFLRPSNIQIAQSCAGGNVEIKKHVRNRTEDDGFYLALERAGYAAGDFEVFRNEDVPSGRVGPITGTVMVRSRKTGIEHTYRVGYGTAWVVDFEKDLRAGNFGA